MSIKNISVRIDENLLNQLHAVADYEGRSANGQILVLIRQCVASYQGIIDFEHIGSHRSNRHTVPFLEKN